MNAMNRCLSCICALALGVMPPLARSQDYPAKPILVVSESNVGSIGDTAIRLVAKQMSDNLGQQVVIESCVGAQGAIAAAAVKRSAPDGYTVFYSSTNGLINARFLLKNIAWDALKDFAPISAVVTTPSFLVVNVSVPANTLKELIDFAKGNPGKLSIGSTGLGSPFHLWGEVFKATAGIDLTHVPYGTGNVGMPVNDLVSGRLQVYFMSYSILRTQIATGKVRVLATIANERYKRLPEMPTIFEQLPDYELVPTLYGMLGPLGMQPRAAERLSAEIRKALQNPDVSGKLDDLGIVAMGSTPEGLTSALKDGIQIVAKVTKRLGIEPQ